jgi:hypothetical protein
MKGHFKRSGPSLLGWAFGGLIFPTALDPSRAVSRDAFGQWGLMRSCLSMVSLFVALGFSALSSRLDAQQTLVVRGVVSDLDGHPVPYAYVSASPGHSTVTAVDGTFELRSVAASTSILSFRRIGFTPTQSEIPTSAGKVVTIAIKLSPLPNTLATVEVRGNLDGYDEYLDRSGYYRRVAKAISGTFIGYEQIERRNPSQLTSLLTDVKGVRVERQYGKGGNKSYVVGRGGLCALGLVVDGQRVEVANPSNESLQPRIYSVIGGRVQNATQSKSAGITETIDDVVPVSSIGAVEVYASASSVPNELHHLTDACGLIVVWTRFKR